MGRTRHDFSHAVVLSMKTYMLQIVASGTGSASWKQLIDDDHRQRVVVGHQDAVLVEENAADVQPVSHQRLLELRDAAGEQLQDALPLDLDRRVRLVGLVAVELRHQTVEDVDAKVHLE